MLLGLDAPGSSEPDHEPPVVRVADREPLAGTITVYAERSLPAAERARLRETVATVELLEEAGLVETARLERWPPLEADGARDAADHPYRECRETAGEDAPVSSSPRGRTADGNGRADLPAVCVAVRVDGDLVGLYPPRTDGDPPTARDPLVALSAGDPLANLE
jgi:hypothetical protein